VLFGSKPLSAIVLLPFFLRLITRVLITLQRSPSIVPRGESPGEGPVKLYPPPMLRDKRRPEVGTSAPFDTLESRKIMRITYGESSYTRT
jgi:hypothetical protein